MPPQVISRVRIRRTAITVATGIVSLVVIGRVTRVLVDWLWFSSVGHVGVFWTILDARVLLFVAVFAASAVTIAVSGFLAHRYARRFGPIHAGPVSSTAALEVIDELASEVAPRIPWRYAITGAAVLLALLIAAGEVSNWDIVLRFLYQVPFGERDPIFGNDIGFYLFSLPVYVALKNWLLQVLFGSTVVAGAVYGLRGDLATGKPPHVLSRAAATHGSALLGLFFLVKAGSYWLDRFLLLYGDNGVVVGASYTDVHVELPVLWLLIGLAIGASVVSWANMRWRSYRIPAAAVLLVFGSSVVFAVIYPAMFQRFYVKPSELRLETPYIEHNIALTRKAYGLAQIAVRPFAAQQGLNLASLQSNRATIENIRLWDLQPLMDTYAQLQEIRTYYRFLSVDIDRYWLDAGYRQVMLSARELDTAMLPANAQTWVNLHLLFTHGNGVVMSPVTEKSAEGLPSLYLQDIPPVSNGGPAIREPRLYFGQGVQGYVIVKGSVPEFDYPQGKENVYAAYSGHDGVGIGSTARRILFAWQLGDPNILLTSYITDASRILLHRNIEERVRTVAPFLDFDHDPYLVVSSGRLFWILDAYTTSRWFPYSQPATGDGTNYIRNAVKVVVDAYNGTVEFFVSDPADPILRTYQRIFPSLFRPLDAMPQDLRQHIRYPEDLFLIQAQLYRTYHMDAPEVFYNREDLWQFPRELAGIDAGNTPGAQMTPYYMIMRLPGEQRAEFVLLLPMVPSQRDNMIAWLAARCDPSEYGKLIVYTFPKDKLVYGPFQIEARIQQNTEISQQISLWNQMGSRVIRGHLVVVPIENSILYVSPLYLRAASGQLPELKRVIAAYGERVVMQDTLAQALAALFEETSPAISKSSGTADARAHEALARYNRALERLKAGDWSGFGLELDALRPLLESLDDGRPQNKK
ncbi:UPF0182 family protein [Paraburkholderia hospita]|uniref:UPF0182 protein C2L64_39245 n=1 Tax=Paraburkholderia hospita TaxID=169430 RepID=A0AAN1JJI2_9BURK|nr:UPF0182 family protein [Paraburkholderia hospita]AUT74299.1 UPF0182 family protein [Paraburkholderia hospita]EIN01278.1 hypothetical protein WQE_10219 [Paraburkholderia hospita]OUL84602.1 hypothetical protein CA601_25785 [Paraburkholderia hospita]OUL86913.1 hypothetical protein CA602_14895 [Paraburkholderia hospita]SEI28269.1 hypothetical protein SAMN05192544_111718 [Paraburkholderia hospita]